MTRWKWARFRGGVMSQLLSTRLPGGIRLLQHPLPAAPTACLAPPPASTRRDIGFTVFHICDMSGLVPANTPVILMSACSRRTERATDHVTFWLEPVSVFGSSDFDGACTAVHMRWTYHPA